MSMLCSCRYFEAVQGQAKGELFGVANLFAIRTVSDREQASSSTSSQRVECLTTEIFKRHEQVEQIVRGRKRIQVMDNFMEYDDDGDEEQEGDENERDPMDPTGLRDIVLDDVS